MQKNRKINAVTMKTMAISAKIFAVLRSAGLMGKLLMTISPMVIVANPAIKATMLLGISSARKMAAIPINSAITMRTASVLPTRFILRRSVHNHPATKINSVAKTKNNLS